MKKSLLSCILALTASSSWAVKANPTPVIITQSDGTQLTIIQHGDEHFSWLSTTDGILLTTSIFQTLIIGVILKLVIN